MCSIQTEIDKTKKWQLQVSNNICARFDTLQFFHMSGPIIADLSCYHVINVPLALQKDSGGKRFTRKICTKSGHCMVFYIYKQIADSTFTQASTVRCLQLPDTRLTLGRDAQKIEG